MQPFGLATPEACKNISPGYAFFAYPGQTFPGDNRTPKVVRGLDPLLSVHSPVSRISILDRSTSRGGESQPIPDFICLRNTPLNPRRQRRFLRRARTPHHAAELGFP